MQREELRSELIKELDRVKPLLSTTVSYYYAYSYGLRFAIKKIDRLSQRDGTFIVDAGDNGVRMSLSKQDSGTNFVEDIEKDNEPKHLHIIPCDFCDNNRHVIDGKNYCDSCYEKRYIKRKTKPDWCEYKCECKVQYCFDPKNDKCPEDSRKDEGNPEWDGMCPTKNIVCAMLLKKSQHLDSLTFKQTDK